MIPKTGEKKKEYTVYGLAVLLIGAWCCRNIGKMDHIVLMNDEFGYWSHAVSAVGYEWKDLITETPYYSWGYSIWLIPIIVFLPTPELWYRAAIILNVLFLIGAYFLCVGCSKRLFPDMNRVLIGIVGLIVMIYPGNIAYVQATWSETLLYMLMWVEMYLIVRLEEKFSAKTYVRAVLTIVYAYMVHAREIGMMIAGIVCLLLILLKYKKNLVYVLLLFGTVFLGYVGIDFVKNHLLLILWDNSGISAINNVGLDVATISKYVPRFTEKFNWLLSSLGGKYIYLLIGTGLTLPVALIQIFREYSYNLKQRVFFEGHSVSKGYSVLALVLMWGICALQINVWTGRKDFIVYGRYMENALGPLLMLGIIYVIKMRKEIRMGILIAGISLLLGLIPVCKCVLTASGQFSTICSPVIGAFCDMTGNETKAFILLGIAVFGLAVILYISSFFRSAVLRRRIILGSFILMFMIIGYYGSDHLLWGRNYYDGMTVPLREKITADHKDRDIYFVKNKNIDRFSTNPKYLQFLIPERSIHVVSGEEIGQILNSDALIMINPGDTDAIKVLMESKKVKKIDATELLEVYVVE